MTAGSSRGGGSKSVSERLPKGYFGKLESRLWQIGLISMSKLLEDPMAPSNITSQPISGGDYGLQLGFTYRYNPKTKWPEAVFCTGILSHLESHRMKEDTTIATWSEFILDLRQRRKLFTKGMILLTPEGEITLTDQPPIGRGRPLGSVTWAQIAELDSRCTRDDYDAYVHGLDTIHTALIQASRED